jgi:hypothetical protein
VDEVQVDLHMLCALMLHGIGGEVNRADVVVGHNTVLGLCAGAGDDGSGSPGDEVGAQEHDVTGCGITRVGTANPVSVGVDHELRRQGGSE